MGQKGGTRRGWPLGEGEEGVGGPPAGASGHHHHVLSHEEGGGTRRAGADTCFLRPRRPLWVSK